MEKGIIEGFLIGIEITLFIICLVINIIDIKKSKRDFEEIKHLDQLIENEFKFEQALLKDITNLNSRISVLEEKIKED